MDLIIEEGRVYGARYYTVQPMWADWNQLEEWCISVFGTVSSIWDKELGRWYMNGSRFWFREKKDLEWFILRWT
jgi:hypothetical protein